MQVDFVHLYEHPYEKHTYTPHVLTWVGVCPYEKRMRLRQKEGEQAMRCERCRGSMLLTSDGLWCIACGWEPSLEVDRRASEVFRDNERVSGRIIRPRERKVPA